jgi:predicted metal-dependent HD superfamily phosphohydrolase
MNEPQPDFNGAGAYVMIRFEQDLSPALVYHNAYHTFEDVLPAATRLAHDLGLDNECVLLIRTAAVFHDTGFLEQVQDHESRSIALARRVLPNFGYSAAQVDCIGNIIAATRLPQRPDGLAQQIICDADLDVLGRDNFLEINRRLLEETRLINAAPPTDFEWYSGQLRFLEGHRYFTPAARALRDPGKQRNIAALRRLLQQTMGHNPARRAPIDNT